MDDLIATNFQTEMPVLMIAVRLFAACLFGALIGFNREYKSRPAGLRTHMLTALAAAMFMVITLEMIAQLGADTDITQMDPIRVVEAVTAGVAFLAAGTIITSRGNVKGLTTGATMWFAGAIGVACGAGYLTLALLGTILSLLILIPVRFFEQHLPKKD